MYRWFYQDMAPHLPMAAMFLFLLLFFTLVARLAVWSRARDFSHAERLPLDDEPTTGSTPS